MRVVSPYSFSHTRLCGWKGSSSSCIDPAFAANSAPLLEWAKRVNLAFYHKNADTISKMRGAWSSALANMRSVQDEGLEPWDYFKGTANACIVTQGRIGWKIDISNAWRVWTDRDGVEHDLAHTTHHGLKQILRRDIAILLWTQSTLNEKANDNQGLWLEPTRAVVFGKDKLLGAMARSAAIGTQWTQDRVVQAGYANEGDSLCRLCNTEEGTLLHRVNKDGCPLVADLRHEYICDLDEAS